MEIINDDYPICFEDNSFHTLNAHLKQHNYDFIYVLVDENTQQHCLPILQKALSHYQLYAIEIRAGEVHKNIKTCEQIWSTLLTKKASRKSLLLNLGGGVIGDMGGFCAATYKRGIKFIQIPTTLLSQVDASVGGKLGIDFQSIKNGIGLFQNPEMVLLYPPFLNSLHKRELYSGFAEIIKHALIQDKAHWNLVKNYTILDSVADWKPIIGHSINLKANVVNADPYEGGLRKILNFGHTIGHAIESLSWKMQQPLLHGEAVAIGMICEAYLSHKLSDLTLNELIEIQNFILKMYGHYDLYHFDTDEVFHLMQQDKKNKGTQILCTLLSGIGSAVYDISLTRVMIEESLSYYQNLTSVHFDNE